MSEQEISHEELETFREEIRDAIETQIFIVVSGQSTAPTTVDPFNLGLSEETIADLTPDKLHILREELYRLVGINSQTSPNSTYQGTEKEGLHVKVFEGHEFDENGQERTYYLHEIRSAESEMDWKISGHPFPMDTYDLTE